MSPAQREAYEDSKLKMRKAMADPSLVDEMDQVLGADDFGLQFRAVIVARQFNSTRTL